MNFADLAALYAAAGVVSGVLAHRATRHKGTPALVSAALAIPLWPLWLPVVLSSTDAGRSLAEGAQSETEAVLLEAHESVRGSPLEALMPKDAVERIVQEIRRATSRHAELSSLTQSESFGLEQARQRLATLTEERAGARTLASARLHLENVQRLVMLRDRDARALEELAELGRALRTQLVLARYAGSSAADASDIVAEVWARVEVLTTAIDDPVSLDEAFSHADQARALGG